MTQSEPAAALAEVLREAQRIGFLGDRAIDDVIDDSLAFVTALEPVDGVVVDLGSGAGVPGLVVAVHRPGRAVVLIDRREKRTDFLRRAVRRLEALGAVGAGEVTVVTDDVAAVARRSPGSFAAAMARGFGPPATTLELAAELVESGGLIAIAEPPAGDRWPADLLAANGVDLVERGRVAVFRRH